MKKAVIMSQEQMIEHVSSICDVTSDGIYSVADIDRPVLVCAVTKYGEEHLGEEYPDIKFFTGNDGIRRCAMKTGFYKEGDE